MPRKKTARSEITYQQSIFEMNDWWPDYLFGLEHDKHEPDLYREHAAIIISGTCVFPRERSGAKTLLRFVGERDIQKPAVLKYEKNWRPLGIGVLEMRGERREYYGHLPYDAIWGLCSALAADRLRFVLLYGPSLKRGISRTTSISFQRSVDLDDY